MASIADLAARVTLVGLTFTAWRPLRKHKPATHALNQANQTSSGKASVILTDAASLKAVFAAQAAAHELNRSLTLGSAQDGLRMLPAGSQLRHADAMRSAIATVDTAAAGFLAEYEHERDTAPTRLGGLYLARHWPSLDSVASHFSTNIRYLPCPQDGAWGAWLEESAQLADAELRERCTDVLTRVVERCRSDGRLYASVLTDVQELASALPAMNLTGAPDLAAIAAAAAELGALNVDQLRDSDTARSAAADRAASILDMLKPQPAAKAVA
jgi:hypothetical protein